MLKVDKRKKNVYDQLVQPYTAGTAVSVSRGYGSQYRLHSTAQLERQRVGPTYMQGARGPRGWGSRSRGVCVGDREIEAR